MPSTTIPGAASAPALDAHVAVPPVGTGPWPGVVVIHEVFGLTADIRAQTDRLASAGYLSVAPDLFTHGGAVRCLKATFASLAAGQGAAFEDIEATRRWLTDRADCTGKIGIIGFCMGGGFALVASARGFDVSAPNYGMLPKDPLEALRGACPIVASYGGRDRALKGAAAQLETTLTQLGVENDVKQYPDAGHSFLNRDNFRPFTLPLRIAGVGFHEPSAEDAWGRIQRFFDAHLRPS